MELWELLAREGVRHTIGSYTFGGDRGRLDDLAACYAEDGVMEIVGEAPVVGRAGIVERLHQVLAMDPAPSHVHHVVANIIFTSVTPELIETSAYFTVFTDIGPDHWGRYRDRLVPVEDRWLFARRHITTTGYADRSFFSR